MHVGLRIHCFLFVCCVKFHLVHFLPLQENQKQWKHMVLIKAYGFINRIRFNITVWVNIISTSCWGQTFHLCCLYTKSSITVCQCVLFCYIHRHRHRFSVKLLFSARDVLSLVCTISMLNVFNIVRYMKLESNHNENSAPPNWLYWINVRVSCARFDGKAIINTTIESITVTNTRENRLLYIYIW